MDNDFPQFEKTARYWCLIVISSITFPICPMSKRPVYLCQYECEGVLPSVYKTFKWNKLPLEATYTVTCKQYKYAVSKPTDVIVILSLLTNVVDDRRYEDIGWNPLWVWSTTITLRPVMNGIRMNSFTIMHLTNLLVERDLYSTIGKLVVCDYVCSKAIAQIISYHEFISTKKKRMYLRLYCTCCLAWLWNIKIKARKLISFKENLYLISVRICCKIKISRQV